MGFQLTGLHNSSQFSVWFFGWRRSVFSLQFILLDFLLVIITFFKVCFFIRLQVLQILYRLETATGFWHIGQIQNQAQNSISNLFTILHCHVNKTPRDFYQELWIGDIKDRNPWKLVPAPVIPSTSAGEELPTGYTEYKVFIILLRSRCWVGVLNKEQALWELQQFAQ